jgi:ATP-dependent helicase/nuclease subunit B
VAYCEISGGVPTRSASEEQGAIPRSRFGLLNQQLTGKLTGGVIKNSYAVAMKANTIKTIYLGRSRPLLHNAVIYLQERWPIHERDDGPTWDLANLLLVLPTARSRRRIATLLAEHADQSGCLLNRPKIITAGELPEQLLPRSLPIATELEQTLAWAQALADTPDDELGALLSRLPAREPLTPWLELASTINTLHTDLAAGELDFGSVEEEVKGEAEQRRWRLLKSLHEKYLQCLQTAGRVDPFAARKDAIKKNKVRSSADVVLIGTSDLPRSVTSMLRAVVDANRSKSKQVGTVTALVAAEEAQRDHFDPFGSIIASQWSKHEIPLTDDQLISAQDVADQASTVAKIVEEWSETYPLHDVTVGITHESLVGPIEFELRSRNMPSHRELGWTIAQTPVGRLLALLSDHLSRNTWRTLAALVRHADFYEFIDQSIRSTPLFAGRQWLTSLDDLVANHYPTRCDNDLPTHAIEHSANAIEIRDLVQQSLRDLRHPARTLSDWAGRLHGWLSEIYKSQLAKPIADVPSRSDQAILTVTKFMVLIQSLEKTLDVKVSAAAAIEMLVSRLALLRVSDQSPTNDRTTLSGWLDLALDDSQAMVITSLNQPYVPESVTADPFLPGTLRSRLQLNDNERRLARDIHALDLMLSSRKRIKLIVGARSLDGSPTPPSRLLAAAKPLDAAKRLVKLLEPNTSKKPLEPQTQTPSTKQGPWSGPVAKTNLPIPTLPLDKGVKVMSVTSFKAYIDCPYRFFLRHVLHLKPLDDASGELQANQFGDLIHNTLDWFGKSEFKDYSTQQTIESALHDKLAEYALHFFGTSPNAAVRMQIHQARARLSSVAVVQSERRRDGWRIHDVETSFGEKSPAGIEVDGVLMPIRGRIDRIDQHDDGRWAIIDYKTHGHPPRAKHLKYENDEPKWIDLQLPLYQLLIPFVIDETVDPSRVSLSYFNIGNNFKETKINDADFTDKEFTAARAKIDDCIRRIRRGEFAPNDDVQYDDYAMIMQTSSVAALFDRLDISETEEAFQ